MKIFGHLWLISIYQHTQHKMKVSINKSFVNLVSIFSTVWPTKIFTNSFTKSLINESHYSNVLKRKTLITQSSCDV